MDFALDDEESPLGKAFEAAKQYGVYLLAAVAVAAAAYYFLFLAPRPGALDVTVMEIDGQPLTGAEITLTNANGDPVGITQITEGGRANFANVPPGAVTVSVDAGSGFQTASEVVEMPSGGSAAASVLMERRNKIALAGGLPRALAASCKDKFPVEVTNEGSDVFEAELVAEGDDAFVKSVSLPDGSKSVFPNETRGFTVAIELTENAQEGASRFSGKIRVKKTKKTLAFDAEIGPPLQIEPSESEISYALGSPDARLLTLRNNGRQALANFGYKIILEEKLREQCGEDGAGCFKIERLGEGAAAIPPGGRVELVVRITPPSTPDDYFASMLFTGTCMSNPGLSVPVRLNLRQA